MLLCSPPPSQDVIESVLNSGQLWNTTTCWDWNNLFSLCNSAKAMSQTTHLVFVFFSRTQSMSWNKFNALSIEIKWSLSTHSHFKLEFRKQIFWSSLWNFQFLLMRLLTSVWNCHKAKSIMHGDYSESVSKLHDQFLKLFIHQFYKFSVFRISFKHGTETAFMGQIHAWATMLSLLKLGMTYETIFIIIRTTTEILRI